MLSWVNILYIHADKKKKIKNVGFKFLWQQIFDSLPPFLLSLPRLNKVGFGFAVYLWMKNAGLNCRPKYIRCLYLRMRIKDT